MHIHKKARYTVAFVALFYTLPGLVPVSLAQIVPTPGAVQAPLIDRQPDLPKRAPDAEVDAKKSEKTAEIKPDGIKILVKKFEYEGNQTITDEELNGVVSDYINKELTIFEIFKVADTVTDFYRARGFSLAHSVVPPQKLSSGTVLLSIIEGRIGEISYEGNELYTNDLLSKSLDELVPGDVLTSETLERELLLLNDLPGLSSRVVVTPGKDFGTSDLLIKSEEKKYEGQVKLNNYGRESIGEWRVEGNISFNNPLGHGDRLTASATFAERGLLDYGALDYSIPIRTDGTRLGINLSRYLYKVDVDKLGLGAIADGEESEGDGTYFRVGVSHPYIRSRKHNVLFNAGISRNWTSQSGTGPFDFIDPGDKESQISLLELSAAYDLLHDNGSLSSFYALLSTNFKGNNDGQEDDAQAAKLTLDAFHLMPLPSDFLIRLHANAVLSADPLVDVEKFRVGGPGNVRGFPSSEIGGDEGFFLNLELDRKYTFTNNVKGLFKVFVDTGTVYRKEPAALEESQETLTSIGVGFSALFSDNYFLDIELAKPTNGRAVSDGNDDGRIWANLTMKF